MKRLINLLIIIISLIFTLPADAMLVSSDDIVFGANSILRDTETGLDWLDINASTTLGKRYTEVNFLLGSEDYAGFRFAKRSELDVLVSNSGYSETGPQSPYSSSPLSSIINSIGPTRTSSSGEFPNTIYNWYYLIGMLEATVFEFHDYGGILGATAYLYSIPLGELTILNSFVPSSGMNSYISGYDFGNTSYLSFPGHSDDTNDPYRGAFLVRSTAGFVPVPEPSTFLLLGGGLVGLGFVVRRKRKG